MSALLEHRHLCTFTVIHGQSAGLRFAGGINFAVFLPHTQETMSEIKLVYFDLRARGEPIRLVLETAGKKYEDVRLSFEEWPAEKPSKCY